MTTLEIAQLVIFAIQEAPVITSEVKSLVDALHASVNGIDTSVDHQAVLDAVSARKAAIDAALAA